MPDRREEYVTTGGVCITAEESRIDYEGAIEPLIDDLDSHLGVLLCSAYEFPGRYTRWDIGFVDPPLAIVAKSRDVSIVALNSRGETVLKWLEPALHGSHIESLKTIGSGEMHIRIVFPQSRFSEDRRSRQPSVFSVLRDIGRFFRCTDEHLGLYGAFGYDLAYQFEHVDEHTDRDRIQRDLVLFLPDRLIVVDHGAKSAKQVSYELTCGGSTTDGAKRTGSVTPFRASSGCERESEYRGREFEAIVHYAKEMFIRGDLFEVVPGQSFFRACRDKPSKVFRRLRRSNPAPYATFMNLGEHEYLVGASPEMYVRVTGRRVETCPISGTIARGTDAAEDSERVRALLNSQKQESELTMCTDVDRNDKSRICVPGSVRIIGRRQIEMYSRVIHTVDHVEGELRPEYDALDAFLSHAWAVTVTGAPKLWAMRFIERHEKSPRRWYGGAIGVIGFNGDMNTGLTLRTMRIHRGVAEIRAGATLLIDSDPAEEDYECHLKAKALIEAIESTASTQDVIQTPRRHKLSQRVLLVDHEDSFVNTLGGYLSELGCDVTTVRSTKTDPVNIDDYCSMIDTVVLSPGPGRPDDFNVRATIRHALQLGLSIFGVCLGLQAIVEYFGGTLGMLPYPSHGRSSIIRVLGGKLFDSLPSEFAGGRYHSLYAKQETMPAPLEITAVSDDSIVMAVEHRDLPVSAVQFHPESLMTSHSGIGLAILHNALSMSRPTATTMRRQQC